MVDVEFIVGFGGWVVSYCCKEARFIATALPSQGNWRTTLLNVTFIGLFYLGVYPYTLYRCFYRSF